ncbi:zonular occludens toxin domain-containing protein [Paucibacter sp. APW11]|uniref:Zonular occludens toxin domain-containing protein n=1 Tax=Roseateles aquae TaxID=3077235 RepID=A0ABU3P5C9_9BURK|nr:zonular occludens toxin domain-containing protein [Paucibacter sp. APW11]MDT8997774.1 zonular occludens toxin domain-containing protein [Paucibacter sp. APW11]
MALTLITGLPGHGKTLYCLWRWRAEAEKEGRQVYHNGIPGLNIPGWQTWEVEKWQQLPPGAVFIVDEAQFAFPVTGRGQTPEWVQKLAVHRHSGVDLVVLTQDPMLLDVFVRKLIDRHFHVVRKFGTTFATIHEFVNGVRDNVAKNKKDSIRHEWKYPPEVYTWYKSAELHTVKRSIPMRVWILCALPLLTAGLAYYGWSILKSTSASSTASEHTPAAVHAPGAPGRSGVDSWSGRGGRDRQTPAEYAESYTPRIPGLAHTAPVYDEVTRPAQAPYPAACVLMRGVCRCYTQQATRLDVPHQLCVDIAQGGYFVAWERPAVQAVPVSSQARPIEQQGPGLIGINAGGSPAAPPPQQVAAADLPAQVPPVRRPIHQDPTRP